MAGLPPFDKLRANGFFVKVNSIDYAPPFFPQNFISANRITLRTTLLINPTAQTDKEGEERLPAGMPSDVNPNRVCEVYDGQRRI